MRSSSGIVKSMEKALPSALYQRVQRTLVISREAGLAFPGVFMASSGRRAGDDTVIVTFKDDPAFRDGRGELDWCALGALVDAALGTASDVKTGPRVRPTAHIELQMTGASTQGDIIVEGHFVAFSERSRVRQSLVSAAIKSGETLIGHASAAFVLLDLPDDKARMPWPWVPEGFRPAHQDSVTFDSNELKTLESCEIAEAAATEAHPFIEHFWCGIPEAGEGKAYLQVSVTPHVANRAGHVQGGLLLGTAVKVANTAAPQNMRLSNLSVYFVRPGVGPVLDVHSNVTQQGRSLAMVRTQIIGTSGKLVLETTSQHVLT
jgi:acyl-coenzyme A thioesterase PaaI-like protein